MTTPAPSYVAAWPSHDTAAQLRSHGITKTVHMTTFFDAHGLLPSMEPYPWTGCRSAVIAAVSEWPVGEDLYLVAEMDCSWSAEIHAHYLAQGGWQALPHRPHVTLEKHVSAGSAARFQHLVGMVLEFDWHGHPSQGCAGLAP